MKQLFISLTLLASSFQSTTSSTIALMAVDSTEGDTVVSTRQLNAVLDMPAGTSLSPTLKGGVLGKSVVKEKLLASDPYDDRRLIVEAYFADIPLLAKIAYCESTFRHSRADGTIVRGIVNKSDLGVMQINEYYHGKTAEALGYDLYTAEGNMAYARNLYEREGSRPWASSSRCWLYGEQVALAN